jgi:Tol biopolymer transport system component
MTAHAGGAFPGLTSYTDYNGYNLRWVSQVRRALQDEGWSLSGEGTAISESFLVLHVFIIFAVFIRL